MCANISHVNVFHMCLHGHVDVSFQNVCEHLICERVSYVIVSGQSELFPKRPLIHNHQTTCALSHGGTHQGQLLSET